MVFNLFDHDDSKIPVEGVASTTEMLVYLYRVWTFNIVPMFIDSPVALLAFQFPYILFTLAFVAPSDVNCVFAPAVGFLPDVEAFFASSVVEDVGINDMGAAFGVTSASTGRASSGCRFRSDYFAIG